MGYNGNNLNGNSLILFKSTLRSLSPTASGQKEFFGTAEELIKKHPKIREAISQKGIADSDPVILCYLGQEKSGIKVHCIYY
jgi:hypothetical protein